MDFKVFYENQLLDELLVKGQETMKDGDTVIASGKYVWVINEDNYDRYETEISEQILGNKQYFDDIYQLKELIREENPDVLIGTIEGNNILLIDSYDWRHHNASIVLKKVAKALGLTDIEVSYFDDNAIGDTKQIRQRIGEAKFYHGTSLAALEQMKMGIKPMGTSNFDNVIHKDKVFVTMNIEKAMFHAMKAAGNHDSFPIIIELRIPDENKLVMDYDVAIMMYGIEDHESVQLGYTDIAKKSGHKGGTLGDLEKRHGGKKVDLSKRFGVFGYKSRIPASFFDAIIFDDNAFPQAIYNKETGEGLEGIEMEPLSMWERFTIPEFKKRISEIENEIASEYEDEEE